MISIYTTGKNLKFHNYYNSNVFIDENILRNVNDIINEIIVSLNQNISPIISDFEFSFYSTLLLDKDNIKYQINSVTFYFPTSLGFWEGLSYENQEQISNNSFILKVCNQFIKNRESLINSSTLKHDSNLDSKYVIFNEDTTLAILRLIYMFALEEQQNLRTSKEVVIKLLDQFNNKYDFWDLIESNKKEIFINRIVSISCEKSITKSDNYIKALKLVNFSTTINYQKNMLNLILYTNTGDRLYIQEDIVHFIDNLYQVNYCNNQLAFKIV